jgi:hypothetical protein
MAAKDKPGGKAPPELRQCLLCGRQLARDEEGAAALNRHFETDCTWRHTNRSPAKRGKGR